MTRVDALDALRRMRWQVLAALVCVALAAGALRLGLNVMSDPPPPAATRTVEPRLTGSDSWAPYRPLAASVPGVVLAAMRGDATRPALHTAGIAHLLEGRPRQALASLQAAAESANDARAWSDLAVALHEASNSYGTPELLADALAAADRARAADPALLEPLFNRALILERLGLRDDARAAWQRYLAQDGTSSWAAEAREHVQRLAPARTFLEKLDAKPGADVRDLVRDNPAEARSAAETHLLGRWGAAVLRADGAADTHLRLAREVGAELTRLGGDRGLALAVAAIDAAAAGERNVLASAHAEYEQGMTLFRASRPVDAGPPLRKSVELFAATRSPMVWRARFFAGNTVFDQGKRDETRRNVDALLTSVPEGFGAHRGEVLWQLAVCQATEAEWGAALRSLHAAAAAFEEVKEPANVAAVRRMLAVVYDMIGDPVNAWSHRMAALRVIGEKSDKQLEKAVASIAGAAILREKWHTALSFLTLRIDVGRRIGADVRLADALLSRAAIHLRLGDAAAARADAAEAEAVTSRVKDAGYAAYGRAAQSLVKAKLAPPVQAVALLTESIALQSAKGDRMNLPGLFLQRGRERRAMRDANGAAADLESGIVELERHRESLPQGSERWGAFFSAEELFEEAIDLAMSREDAAAAFALAERARARTLLETYGVTSSGAVRPGGGAVVVEYVTLPTRLVVFVADENGVTATSVAADRNELAREANLFANALSSDDARGAKRAAAALYRRLVEPVAARLTNARTVVFVPDRTLATLPFNALTNGEGEYLLERHAIVVAPSAAAYVTASSRRAADAVPESVVVIGNAAAGAETGRLVYVEAEAREVARAYPRSVKLEDEAANLGGLRTAIASADVAHFAGHAVGDESGLLPASLVLRRGTGEHRVTVPEIAALRLRRPVTVVLAGCSTARGESRGTDGVISVANGFLFAGAPSVVATLWPIDDRASALFFPRLHRRLAEGLPPAEALRAVQLDAIRRGDVPASLWAALIDIGS
ncbi:MAG TPA: CHAT domain-containing protein [Thermoanaerobaculia bacterium]